VPVNAASGLMCVAWGLRPDLKVKPGQTIRILVREASSSTDLPGYFPEILLTLK